MKTITDKFFTSGPNADFFNAFVKGEGDLSTTSESIRGLPRAWPRNYGKPGETQSSLLDLPDPSIPDSASRSLSAVSILDMVKENNHLLIPCSEVLLRVLLQCMVCKCRLTLYPSAFLDAYIGCGKTRAVIELLPQH